MLGTAIMIAATLENHDVDAMADQLTCRKPGCEAAAYEYNST